MAIAVLDLGKLSKAAVEGSSRRPLKEQEGSMEGARGSSGELPREYGRVSRVRGVCKEEDSVLTLYKRGAV